MDVEVGRYKYPQQRRCELWYQCPKRLCTVYLEFPDGCEGDPEVRHALNATFQNDTCAIRVTRKCPKSALSEYPQYRLLQDRLVFTVCEFKPYRPHFNSDFRTVDHDELIDVKQLKDNIKVVSFHGDHFLYKFMTSKCYQFTFETEVENYRKLAGVAGIPALKAVI